MGGIGRIPDPGFWSLFFFFLAKEEKGKRRNFFVE